MSTEQVRTFGGWREARPFGVLGMDGRQTITALVLLMASILAGSITFVLLLLGAALILGTLPGLVAIPAFMWALTRFVIRDEEAMLEREFGDAYRDYKARVRRWL